MASTGKKKADESLNVQKILFELQNAGEDGDFDKGLKLSEELLGSSPDDRDALRCKLVCLVQLSRFDNAIKLIQSLNDAGSVGGPPQFSLEKAYCLYRLERYQESLSVLGSKPSALSYPEKELKAQILYRLELHEEARSIYLDMVKNFADDYGNERESNLAAVLSFCDLSADHHHHRHPELEGLRSETMEQCFNLACCQLAMGRIKRAQELLRASEDICRESMTQEECTEEEIEREIAVVRTQLGYSLQVEGKQDEAMATYNAILKQKSGDTALTVVASNNIIVLNREKDVFDSKKKAKVLAGFGGSKKLSQSQKALVLFNRCLFALQTNQLEQSRQLSAEMGKKFPNSELSLLVKVAVLNREKKQGECIKLLEEHCLSSENSSQSLPPSHPPTLLLYLTLAQLHLSQGNVRKACAVLGSVPELHVHLGVVSVLVALYTGTGSTEEAVKVLDDAVQWWSAPEKKEKEEEEEDRRTLQKFMLENARYKLHHGLPKPASDVLERLRNMDPSNTRVLALLISSYSRFDPKRAEEQSRLLPQAIRDSQVDVDALEQMPSFKLHRQTELASKTTLMEAKTSEGAAKEKKKRKKRKKRLPKNFDQAALPDPERWLPLRERSYYRRGRKKGFVGSVGRGTQGSSAATATITAQLDASKKPAVAAPQDATGVLQLE